MRNLQNVDLSKGQVPIPFSFFSIVLLYNAIILDLLSK